MKIDKIAIVSDIGVTERVSSAVHGPWLMLKVTVVRIKAGREVVGISALFTVETAKIGAAKRSLG